MLLRSHLVPFLAVFCLTGCLIVPTGLPAPMDDAGKPNEDAGSTPRDARQPFDLSALDSGADVTEQPADTGGDDAGPDASDPCAGRCTPSETRCDPQANPPAVQRCRIQADGCGAWELWRQCDVGQRCDAETGCVCLGTTCIDGEYSCLGDVLQLCSDEETVCGRRETVQNCAESLGLGCEQGETACTTCVCTRGEERCVGNQRERCVDGQPGCARWLSPTAPYPTAEDCANQTVFCAAPADCLPCGTGFYCPG